MTGSVLYVYGVATGALDVAGAPAGLDGAPVLARAEGELAALYSVLDAEAYAARGADAQASDVAWVSERAVAHDEVLTWVSERGGVVPFPMFTMFSGFDAMRDVIEQRRPVLARLLERVAPAQEYAVRVYALDPQLGASLGARSPELAELERQAAAAAPGRRFLIERKLEDVRRSALQRARAEVADTVMEALSARAIEFVRDVLPAGAAAPGGGGPPVLDASFLVRRDAAQDFHRAVRTLAEAPLTHGFRVEMTGPWAPYHFVRDAR